jgi:predicted component of type VI protein secretion system
VPRLIIKSISEGFRVFDVTKETTVIGRGDDADLVLPNISVSRHHARVVVVDGIASIEDMESSNGTLLNGKETRGSVLTSGDEILLGKFSLVYMGDGAEDRFYNGRYLEYMMKYESAARTFDDSTFAMSPDQLQKLQSDVHTMKNARMVLVKNQSRFWHPEDQGLTFGDEGMVAIEAMFTGGVVADIVWDGKQHVLNKQARLLKLSVNEEATSSRPLRPGDRVRIGNSLFLYELPVAE